MLDGGVIQQIGTPRELYDAPVNRFVAEFVGSINLYPGCITGAGSARRGIDVLGIGTGSLPATRVNAPMAASDGAALIAFRPHAVHLDQARGGDGFAFEADVVDSEFIGEFVRYELRVVEARVVADLPHARLTEVLPPGRRARFFVPESEILVLTSDREG